MVARHPSGYLQRMSHPVRHPSVVSGGNRVRRPLAQLLWVLLLTAIARPPLAAQLDLGGTPIVGGDQHWYQRTRALRDSSSADPWRTRVTTELPSRGFHARLLRPEIRLLYNSLRPSDGEDGVIWAGRGVTGAAQAGVEARWGIVRVQLAPVAFRTQNLAFPLIDNGHTDQIRFRDGRFPGAIDLPQRFGDEPYGRLDPGDSFLSLEWMGVTLGLSSARQQWGPAREFPLVLGTRAGGFPHLFAGTYRPISLGFGTIEGRLIGARLDQTRWSPVQTGEGRRFHSGLTMTFRPRGLSWLEIGGNRTETSQWPEGGPTLADALGPFSGIMNAGNTSKLNTTGSNGFASAFTRIAVPGSGLEIYGELSWEDFANDARRFLQKPDDLNTLTLGLGRAWGTTDGTLHWLGFEMTNGELSHHERGQRGFSGPFPPYIHSPTVQGLTSNGQVLGSLATYRGAGAAVTYTRYTAQGKLGLQLRRELMTDPTPTIAPQVALSSVFSLTRFLKGRELGADFGPSYLTRSAPTEMGGALGFHLSVRWRGF